jgi:hypothetical protein
MANRTNAATGTAMIAGVRGFERHHSIVDLTAAGVADIDRNSNSSCRTDH